jgi:glycosyltransferase involved in cell wall biosynthesis
MGVELTKKAVAGAERPLVSVVMPTYNRASLLDRAIRSALNQTYNNLEIIVVDDASSDETPDVVKAFQDQRVRYIRHETNRGGSAARNTGIRNATGEFIAFLDDDDEWEPEKTVQQLEAMGRYDVVLCTSNESGRGTSKFDSKTTVNLDDLRRGDFTAGGTGVLMARSAVLKETLFDEILPKYQDWDLFIRLAQKCEIGYLNMRLVRYNEGAHHRISNKILTLPAPVLEKQLQMLEKHREFFGSVWYRRHMSRAILYGIKHRPDKYSHILYAVRRYGMMPVMGALAIRMREKVVEHWLRK